VASASHRESVLWDLESLAAARRFGDWQFEQLGAVGARTVAEVGAGIGAFSERLLAAGARRLLLVEPEPLCAEVLERRFAEDPRVTLAREELPQAPSLRGDAGFDLIVCQNVLEHVADHAAAVAAMAGALLPGGRLAVLVPAHPRLYGALDRRYGHARRYTRELLRTVLEGARLEVSELRSFNLLGVPGWWIKSRSPTPRLSPRSLAAYEALLPLWRPLEERLRPPWGLSLVALSARPTA